jgi:2-oxoglutarate ferredoxin oxidoreductase subunit alpha
MMDKRERKMKNFKIKDSVSVYGNKKSKNVIIGWGSTKGIILEALNELNYKFVQVKQMHPFPAKELIKKIGKHDNLILVEQNMTGQLGSLINEHTNLKINKKLLKYDGRTFNPIDIIRGVK